MRYSSKTSGDEHPPRREQQERLPASSTIEYITTADRKLARFVSQWRRGTQRDGAFRPRPPCDHLDAECFEPLHGVGFGANRGAAPTQSSASLRLVSKPVAPSPTWRSESCE